MIANIRVNADFMLSLHFLFIWEFAGECTLRVTTYTCGKDL